jgi:NAD(P)-dependent dehydrogenase (short-subunit alcohol dehydrogenase family)
MAEAAARSLRDLMKLDGRVALVTGGAGHVGRAAAEGLLELGATVVLLDRDGAACAAAVTALGPTAPAERLGSMVVDLEDEAAVRAVPAQVGQRYGGLDVLVNNAALVGTSDLDGWAVAFEKQSAATWRRALEVNLTAPFVLAQACAPLLAGSGHGAIVNIASIYGLVGPQPQLYEGTAIGNPAAYGASKGGLLQLTRWLAVTLAPSVRVNAIVPGGIERGQAPEFVRRYEERTPLGRMAREEDLKGAITYLASDLSAYVTGQALVVDGGWTAW